MAGDITKNQKNVTTDAVAIGITASNASQANKTYFKPFLLMGAAAVLLLLIVSIFAVHNKHKPAQSNDYINYSTVKTSTFTLAGSGAGQGISFELPATFSVFLSGSNSQSSPNYQKYIAVAKNSNKYTSVGRAVVTSYTFAPSIAPDANFYNQLTQLFALNPSTTKYQDGVVNLKNVVKGAFPEQTIAIKMGGAKPFTNAYIHKNAWQIDISTTDSAGLTPAHQGKLLWIGGSASFYRFMVAAADPDWNNQHNVWQAVLNSVKIDQ